MKKSEWNKMTTCSVCKEPLDEHPVNKFDSVSAFGGGCLKDYIPFDDDTPEEIAEWRKWDKKRMRDEYTKT